jgi:hypothetical protein
LSELQLKELHFLLDSAGALIVYQEKGTAWAGVLGFSSEANAREFCRASNLDVAEIAAIATDDREAVTRLVTSVKRRSVRNLLLDLDYRSGRCVQVEFEGDAFGPATERQFTPHRERD